MVVKYTRLGQVGSAGNTVNLSFDKNRFWFGVAVGFCIFIYLCVRYTDTSWTLQSATHYGSRDIDSKEVEKLLVKIQDVLTLDPRQSKHQHQHTTIAGFLAKQVKILCWIMTSPGTLKERAIHVNQTWGRRCNKILFMSTKPDDTLSDVIALPVSEGRDFLWAKTKEALRYIYRYHLDEYDWFLKADDDTYVVMENLRYMLYPYSADMPLYFGRRFKMVVTQGYMSGGAGYVLSKEAMRRFAEKGIHDEHKCRIAETGDEDVYVGECMDHLGVLPGDSRDNLHRKKFFATTLENQIFTADWLRTYDFYTASEGLDCCSNYAVSFHYVKPHEMYVYDYMIYNLQAYGHFDVPQSLPAKMSTEEMLKTINLVSTTSAKPTNVNNNTTAATAKN